MKTYIILLVAFGWLGLALGSGEAGEKANNGLENVGVRTVGKELPRENIPGLTGEELSKIMNEKIPSSAPRSFSLKSCSAYPNPEKFCFKACDNVDWAFARCPVRPICMHTPLYGWSVDCHSKFKIFQHPLNIVPQKALYCSRPNLPCSPLSNCPEALCTKKTLLQAGYCPRRRCTQLYYTKQVSGVYASPVGVNKFRPTTLLLRIPGGCSCLPTPATQTCDCKNRSLGHFSSNSVPSWSCDIMGHDNYPKDDSHPGKGRRNGNDGDGDEDDNGLPPGWPQF